MLDFQLSNNYTLAVNTTELMNKVKRVFDSLSTTDTISNLGISLRALDENVWEEVGLKIQTWSNLTSFDVQENL